MGSNLSSPAPVSSYTPPPASRHALFSHHAIGTGRDLCSPSAFSGSEMDPSGPPSPTASISSGAFSPASAFLSHFSSSNSLISAPPLPPDAQGAQVLDYTLGKLVGRGGFSSVRQARHNISGETFACKIVKRDDLSDRSGSLEKFEEEIKLWKSLPRHPSLLPLLEVHRTPFATFLIIPYMPGGSLLDVLRREGGSEKTARKWFSGVVAAVSAMHEGYDGFEGKILHGDLKLENFLADHSGAVVVCDFYMAERVDEARSVPLLVKHATLPLPRGMHISNPQPPPLPSASLPYAPPELLRTSPSGSSLAQDIWALGVILHALLTSRLPFTDTFDPRLQMKILRGTWDVPADVGQEWVECLYGCLEGNVHKRWDIKRLRQSDAVIGWRQVKARSKSRSRSRAQNLFESRRVEPAPIPIKASRGSISRDPPSALSQDPFNPRSRSASVSGSGSRSRSSGRSGIEFTDVRESTEDNVARLETMSITRGRSTSKESLMYLRQSGEFALSNTAATYYRPDTSPTATKGSRSASSRRWDQPYEYREELRPVDEERARGRTGRSRSRGRPDR